MSGKTLVPSPEAGEFIDTMSLKAGRNSRLGNPDDFTDIPNVHNAVVNAHEAVTYVLPKMKALVDDPTRTLPELHDVGRQFADRTNEVLTNTNRTVTNEAAKAEAEARELIHDSFSADPSRAGIESEIRTWVRENARTEGGMAKIREAVETNREVAAVIYHSPDFLLGISKPLHDALAMDGVIAHLPKAGALMVRSVALTKLASNYPQVIRSVNASFYVAGIADQMRLRVEA